MLYGPSGNGKTMLVHAVANERGCTLFHIVPSTFVSQRPGDPEKFARVLFNTARPRSPSIILIDKVDAMLHQGDAVQDAASRRMLTELLQMLNGAGADVGERVVLFSETRVPWEIDPAMRRRLGHAVYVPMPDAEARAALFKSRFASMPKFIAADDVDFDALSREIEPKHYSCADVIKVIAGARESATKRIDRGECARTDTFPVTLADFHAAVQKTASSVDSETLARFDAFAAGTSA